MMPASSPGDLRTVDYSDLLVIELLFEAPNRNMGAYTCLEVEFIDGLEPTFCLE